MILSQRLNRPIPALGPEFFKTYEVSRPRSTHFRKATCSEVECPNRERGWVSMIHTNTPLGVTQANYIRLHSGRRFDVISDFGGTVTFRFPPGQDCFSEHKVPLDREPIFRKLDGDWRGYGTARVLRSGDWLDDFGEHQERLADQQRVKGVAK